MDSSSALRRLKVTSSHLKQEENSSLEKNTTSGLSPTSKVVPLPPHLPISFDKLRKRHQFIEDLDEAKEFLGDYTNFTNTGPVIVAKVKNKPFFFSHSNFSII